ncbi:hypothetical protein MMC19_006464 [Ptychographa xylographoides]|nr:hypothetical protein [Ptychographa xylographoides]
METDWSLDYCLACDRQTAGEAYCSQVCRLADLESSAAGSEPASPTHCHPAPWTVTSRSPVAGFFLPPAFNFAAYRSASAPLPATSRPRSTHTFSSPTSPTHSRFASSPRILTPSSSRSSLTSVQSVSSQGEFISRQARIELRDYTNSFDQVRDWRRRMTTA